MPEDTSRGRLSPELLAMPAPHATRLIARGLLDDLLEMHGRLERDEADALHDLRVAMRRLRSWLRAFRPELSDTVRGRTRRRLRALAAATGEARDAEVALAFIESQSELSARNRATARAIAAQLEQERDDRHRKLRRTLARDLAKVARELERQLESYWERHRLDEPSNVRPMSAVFADAMQHHVKQLESALVRIEPPGRANHVHRARIAAKRLRYLFEPLSVEFGAEEVLRPLRALQQQLGDTRDAHRISMRFVREIGESAARDARGRALATAGITGEDDGESGGIVVSRSGLTELARRAHVAREAAFSEFSAKWGDAEVTTLVEAIDDVASRVTSS